MVALRLPLLVPLATLLGCTELVVLGDECPRNAACVVELDGNVIDPPIDAGLDPAEPSLDSGDLLDAHPDVVSSDGYVPAADDASVWLLPPLQNPSFELTDGQPGDVAAVSLPTGTVIAPWFSCQPIGGGPGALTGVRAENVLAINDGRPSVVIAKDGLTFIAMQYFVALFAPALVQELSTPLRAGTEYGFALDVRITNPDARLSLQVYGAQEPCVGTSDATLLAETGPLSSTGWQTACLRFTAPVDLPYFMLVESAPDGLSNDRLFFDNLRSVESCPP